MLPKRKVLYLSPTAELGGAETFLQHTAKFHNSQQIEPIYLCFRHGPLVEILKRNQRTVFILPTAPRLRNPLLVWKTVQAIRRIVREHDVQLIHSTMAYGAIFGGLASLLSGCAHVWFQHGPVTGWMDRWAAKLPCRTIFVNSAHTEKMQAQISPSRKLQRLVLGVDQERIALALQDSSLRDSLRKKWSIGEDTFLVGTVCRPQPQKGLEHFVRAIHALQPKGKIAGIILGASERATSSYEQKILDLIKELGVPVQLLPSAENAIEQMRAFDVVVSTAVSPEAFGLTILESMALGIPTLAPEEGGPRDILEAGKTGYFFIPRNLNHLVQSLEEIMASPLAQREKMAKLAIHAAREHFPASQSIAAMENSYREILSN